MAPPSTESAAQVPELQGAANAARSAIPPDVPPAQGEIAPETVDQDKRPAVGIVMTPPCSGTADTEVVDKLYAR